LLFISIKYWYLLLLLLLINESTIECNSFTLINLYSIVFKTNYLIIYLLKAPKKAKIKDANQRLQKEVEKAIRMNIEEEVRAKALKDGKQLITNEKINNSNN
jgi:hypothetical protein